MKMTDQKDKMLFKNRKKASLNFVFLKILQFLDAQEFYHKSILQPRFEAGEANGSRVERPEK